MISLRRIYFTIFYTTTFLLFFFSYSNYIGSKIIFTIYSLISILFFLYLTNRKSFYIENFIALYFFLGYWFGFCIKIVFFKSNFDDYSDGYGGFDFLKDSYDEVITIISFAFLAFIFSSFFRRLFIVHSIINFEFKKFLHSFNEINLSIILLVISVLLSYLNYTFGIFQRGAISNLELNFILNSFIKWSFSFGYLTIFSFIIFWFIKTRKNLPHYLAFSYIITEFVVSLSMSSRVMIFNGSSIFWGIKKILQKTYVTKVLYFFILLIILFVVNIYLVDKIRVNSAIETSLYTLSDEKKEDENREKKKNVETKNSLNKFIQIIISRIHGFEALMAVQSINDKNFDFFLSGLKSKTLPGEVSFFDNLKNDNRQKNFTNNSITLPGLLAFLYYSGSIYFVVIICFSIIILISSFEKLIYILSGGNLIFVSFICHMIAFRLWHFGHNPLNTYIFLISILLSVILVIFLKKIFN